MITSLKIYHIFFYRFSSKLFSTTLCFHILAIVLWRILNSSLICIRLFCDPIKGHCESRCSLSWLFEATILLETVSFLWGWETMEGFDVSGHLTQSINMTVEKCHQEGSCSLIPHLPRAENPLQGFGGSFNKTKKSIWSHGFPSSVNISSCQNNLFKMTLHKCYISFHRGIWHFTLCFLLFFKHISG